MIALILFLVSIEIGIRLTDLDIRFLRFTLYYSSADSDVYRPSKNPNLLYELIPGAFSSSIEGMHPKERPDYVKTVTVNEWGYRYSPWGLEKPPGVFRIVIFGGSNTYGYSVSDEDTFSYQLFKKLEKSSPKKFEVWNGGITASVLSQKVEFARRAAVELKPDLIIFKHFHNDGRRAFYSRKTSVPDVSKLLKYDYFSENSELFIENIPFLFNDDPKLEEWHRSLVGLSATYRLIHALINYHYVKIGFPNHTRGKCEIGEAMCKRVSEKYSKYGDYVSERELDKFISEYGNSIKLIMFDPVKQINCGKEKMTFHGLPLFSLCTASKPEEYRHIHPPSYVYSYYADVMADYLIKNKFISLK